jgi:retron-type reverse transcriptase
VVECTRKFCEEGYMWVVDIDVARFFDTVDQDVLMGMVAVEVKDKRVFRLIRCFLKSGVMVDGLVSPTGEGVPQGGSLSPLLSNIYLSCFDRELESRGHRFVRYADDCNILNSAFFRHYAVGIFLNSTNQVLIAKILVNNGFL